MSPALPRERCHSCGAVLLDRRWRHKLPVLIMSFLRHSEQASAGATRRRHVKTSLGARVAPYLRTAPHLYLVGLAVRYEFRSPCAHFFDYHAPSVAICTLAARQLLRQPPRPPSRCVPSRPMRPTPRQQFWRQQSRQRRPRQLPQRRRLRPGSRLLWPPLTLPCRPAQAPA